MHVQRHRKQHRLIREGAWPSDECDKWTHIEAVRNTSRCAAEALDGIAILRNSTANLTMKRQAQDLGADTMKMDPAVFSNDRLNSTKDGTTVFQSTVNAQSLTSDPTLVKTKILNVN